MDKSQAIAALSPEDQVATAFPESYVNPAIKNVVGALLSGVAQNVATPGKLAYTPNPYSQQTDPEAWQTFEDSRSQAASDWATHNALSMMGTGAPFAETGAAGIFGGKLSKIAQKPGDLNVKRWDASSMAIGGHHPDEIWQQTGWYRNPADQKWRFEIPDNKMGLNYMPASEGDMAQSTVGQLVNHPELFQHYPDLRSLGMFLTKDSQYPTGHGLFDGRSIYVNAPDINAATSVAVHELQHGVSGLEGFTHGADPSHYAGMIEKGLRANPALLQGNKFMDVVNQARPLYNKTAGEVEARNVQSRLDWTPAERQLVPPWYSQDVPFAQQFHHDPVTGIVRALQK